MSIKLLSKNIANQIAAGEVIERPASVVKELLENSIDACASVIEVVIDKAGLQLIRIIDDGNGIDKHDLPLAIAQHATSKIEQLDDLQHLASLGFRGEALASIDSVAEVSIQSKKTASEHAWQLDKEHKINPVAHPDGTTIDVRNLFANVPVRRKFLKSDRTEFSHIEDVVRRIALSAPEVAFHLSHNEKSLFRLLPANNEQQCRARLAKLLNKSFAEKSIAFDEANQDLRLWGWVLPNEFSRAHADQQYFFVNGRMVKDRVLQHAVRMAFSELYQQARYPAYVIYLECPAHFVDVNVHPTKHEVRFVDARLVHDFVQSILHRLQNQASDTASRLQNQGSANHHVINEPRVPYQVENIKKTHHYKPMAFIEKTYLVIGDVESLQLIHYPRAVKFLNKLLFASDNVKAQPLLIPETIVCDNRLVEDALAREEQWQRYGINLRQVGPDTLMVRTLPHCLHGASFKPLLAQLLQQKPDDVIECLSEHCVLQESLSREQMQTMIEQLAQHDAQQLQDNKILLPLNARQLEQWFL